MASDGTSYPDIYGFPEGEDTRAMLWWMGEDYVGYILEGLQENFERQQPGTVIQALYCEEEPEFYTFVDQESNRVTRQVVGFELQALLQDAQKCFWRLSLSLTCACEQPEPGSEGDGEPVSFDCEVKKSFRLG